MRRAYGYRSNLCGNYQQSTEQESDDETMDKQKTVRRVCAGRDRGATKPKPGRELRAMQCHAKVDDVDRGRGRTRLGSQQSGTWRRCREAARRPCFSGCGWCAGSLGSVAPEEDRAGRVGGTHVPVAHVPFQLAGGCLSRLCKRCRFQGCYFRCSFSRELKKRNSRGNAC